MAEASHDEQPDGLTSGVTRRKPFGLSWESWIERQIRDGMERGEFDDLALQGKPLPDIDQPRDELRWVKDKLRREGADLLPPTLVVRRELDQTRDRLRAATTEAEVRELVAAINERIRNVNRTATAGPPSTLVTLDLGEELERWRSRRPS
jgi:hypothetical protein